MNKKIDGADQGGGAPHQGGDRLRLGDVGYQGMGFAPGGSDLRHHPLEVHPSPGHEHDAGPRPGQGPAEGGPQAPAPPGHKRRPAP